MNYDALELQRIQDRLTIALNERDAFRNAANRAEHQRDSVAEALRAIVTANDCYGDVIGGNLLENARAALTWTQEQADNLSLQLSADALRLAVHLSGHARCAKAVAMDIEHVRPCELCLGDAATIDRELALPQRNAALLLAQGLCDLASDVDKHSSPILYECGLVSLSGNIDALREALKAL